MATGGSGDEFTEAQERLASLLIDKFARMIEPLEQRMAKLEGGAPVKGGHQGGSKDASILDDHFRTPTSANFGELPDRRESLLPPSQCHHRFYQRMFPRSKSFQNKVHLTEQQTLSFRCILLCLQTQSF